jgi:uncharacterized protein YcbX
MKVEQLIIYPVKSLGGMVKNSWMAENTGFLYDRKWMLIDQDGVFITQRQFPQLCTFDVNIVENVVHVYKEGQQVSWHVGEKQPEIIQTKVWNDDAHVQAVSHSVNQFFSDWLRKEVRLVREIETLKRKHFATSLNQEIQVSLADGYPYLVLGTASVQYLSERLHFPVHYSRFRPNILINTDTPHEEDEMGQINIGQSTFTMVKPCVRCQVVNINQHDGVVTKETLQELASYRRCGNGVCFGVNMVCTREGIISVGDTIKV